MSAASFVATSILILITPGPTNTLLAASGAAYGLHRAAPLPPAEALGYALAISAYLAAANVLAGMSFAMPALKAIAAAWLLLSAARLWQDRPDVDPTAIGTAFRRVLITTILNPKAMLVGAILIPAMMADRPLTALASFIALSVLAGMAWLALGSIAPSALRPYAYKAAALVLGAFSIAAATSSLHG